MKKGSAQDLLFGWARRPWPLFVMTVASTGCILPPNGEDTPDELNYPPEIFREGMRPLASRVFVEQDCDAFRVALDGFLDRDDDRLLLRWVVDNNTSDAFHVRDNSSTCCAGELRATDWRLVPRTDFKGALEDASATGKGVGVLSLFVTDASVWANPSPDNADPDIGDLGRVASADAANTDTVVEARWTFVFQSTGECPQ